MTRYRLYDMYYDCLIDIDINPNDLVNLINDYIKECEEIDHKKWLEYLDRRNISYTILKELESKRKIH